MVSTIQRGARGTCEPPEKKPNAQQVALFGGFERSHARGGNPITRLSGAKDAPHPVEAQTKQIRYNIPASRRENPDFTGYHF